MKTKLDLKLFIEIILSGILTLGLVLSYHSFLTSVPRSALASSFLEEQIFVEINQIRKENKLPELQKNIHLERAAKQKNTDMISNNYFSHISPNNKKWSDFIKDEKYDYIYAGENLAKDYDNSKEIIAAWIESPTHKENILNPDYSDTGIAVSINKSSKGRSIIVAQEFGKKI